MTTRPRPSHRCVKTARLGGVVIGLVAALALILPSAAPAATRHVTKAQLSAASEAWFAANYERVAVVPGPAGLDLWRRLDGASP